VRCGIDHHAVLSAWPECARREPHDGMWQRVSIPVHGRSGHRVLRPLLQRPRRRLERGLPFAQRDGAVLSARAVEPRSVAALDVRIRLYVHVHGRSRHGVVHNDVRRCGRHLACFVRLSVAHRAVLSDGNRDAEQQHALRRRLSIHVLGLARHGNVHAVVQRCEKRVDRQLRGFSRVAYAATDAPADTAAVHGRHSVLSAVVVRDVHEHRRDVAVHLHVLRWQ
jgi:hypothetical protein